MVQWFLDRSFYFLIPSMRFCFFVCISLWKCAWPLYFGRIETPYTQGCIVRSWVENGPVVLEKKIFKYHQHSFANSKLFSIWKGAGIFICTNLNISPSSKNLCCQVRLKFAQWFWWRRFKNFINVFSLFRYCLPLEKGGTIHLNKLEFLSPKEALWQVW